MFSAKHFHLPTKSFQRHSTLFCPSLVRTSIAASRTINTAAVTLTPTRRSQPAAPLPTHQLRRPFSQSTTMSGSQINQHFTRDKLFDLSGRVALVTGGGSGIGLMAAQALANNGAKVYIVGRTAEKLDRVVETYGKDLPGQLIALPGDVASKEGVQKLYDDFAKHEQCLCILVNNAGISSNTTTTESEGDAAEMRANLFDKDVNTFEDWNNTYNTNVTGYYFMTAAFLPLLSRSTERHHGWSSTVINITSISGMIKAAQHHFAYNASKAAAEHLTRMFAAEAISSGLKIRINGIAPGVFPSEMTADESDDRQKSHIDKSKFEGKVPANRPGRDEDMAQAVLFFAANQYLSGQTLAVDGGYTLEAGL